MQCTSTCTGRCVRVLHVLPFNSLESSLLDLQVRDRCTGRLSSIILSTPDEGRRQELTNYVETLVTTGNWAAQPT